MWKVRRILVATITLAVGAAMANGWVFGSSAQRPAEVQEVDVVIRNGRVMDPETGTDAILAVAVDQGRIVALGSAAEKLRGRREIDARNLVVAPGFIDLLARLTPEEETQSFKVMDGVTAVFNMHGGPVNIPAYFESFQEVGASYVHYGTTVGHNPLRRAVGLEDRHEPATPEQIEQMKRLAAQAIRDGAVGIGFGINYVPGASYEEVLALFEVAADHGVPCHLHVRYKGSVFPQTIVAALQEVITAAAVTGTSAQVVHLGSSSVGSMEVALEMITGARRHGIDIAADVYPYLANSTNLASAIYDPGWQERFGGITYSDIQLVETGERLTQETFERYRKEGAQIITHFIPEEEVLAAYRNPYVMVASDGIIRNGKGHPRGAGTFARFLGYYVREKKVGSLMEGLRKITLLPAQRLEQAAPAMKRKGRLQVGADADLTLFDPNTIIDRATYENPAQYSAGIHYVLVNGVVVVDQSKLVNVQPGQPVKHE
ncbi:amidohydrolase family protein [Acidobacteriia bacterium AH_259_A11_L15]|nr:amidohydrolase family protein [Acidobacteriia bacterium AH_259_A11_L15]